jgi:predicted ATPase
MLLLGEKELRQLSPGERGALLIVFYLLVDRETTPLMIDQPEHNLDNETVARLLVPAIKKSKSRRQLIIVTHNPILAVVCNADQIIVASLDIKGGNKVRYESGAIENPRINRKVVDVLEGTLPSFDNRHRKYIRERLTEYMEAVIGGGEPGSGEGRSGGTPRRKRLPVKGA